MYNNLNKTIEYRNIKKILVFFSPIITLLFVLEMAIFFDATKLMVAKSLFSLQQPVCNPLFIVFYVYYK